MPEYKVKNAKPPHSVEFKGKLYGPGEAIPGLPDKEAERLLKSGKIEEAESGKPGKKADDAGPSIEDLVAAAMAAIERGETIGDGRPKVEDMEETLGEKITARQRDEAWEAIQKAQGNN